MTKFRSYYKLILRNFILPAVGFILGLYIKFVFKTSKVKIINAPEAQPFFNGLKPAIYAFWHGRLLMMATIHQHEYNMHVLVSKNEIGIMADHCMRQFGIKFIRGSSHNPNKPDRDKGGREAFREILKTLKKGYPVGITPDGPLGPAHKVNKGVITAAILSQKPIIPLTYASKKGYYAKSWDQFLIPYPFGTLYFRLGAPIHITREENTPEGIDRYCKILEKNLNQDMCFLEDKLKDI